MKARVKKSNEEIEAHQWFKIGDYSMVEEIPEDLKEHAPVLGNSKRYYRDGEAKGYFRPSGQFAFSGDWIILVNKIYDIISSKEFDEKYELIDESTKQTNS